MQIRIDQMWTLSTLQDLLDEIPIWRMLHIQFLLNEEHTKKIVINCNGANT